MEMRGVGPLSEILSSSTSTGLGCHLDFPRASPDSRGQAHGSFISTTRAQSFDRAVLRFDRHTDRAELVTPLTPGSATGRATRLPSGSLKC